MNICGGWRRRASLAWCYGRVPAVPVCSGAGGPCLQEGPPPSSAAPRSRIPRWSRCDLRGARCGVIYTGAAAPGGESIAIESNGRIYRNFRIYGNVWVYVSVWIYGHVRTYVNVRVYGNVRIYANVRTYVMSGYIQMSGYIIEMYGYIQISVYFRILKQCSENLRV